MELNAAFNFVIVEDNPEDSFWLKRELKKATLGATATVFANAIEAFDFIKSSSSFPLVLFLDLHLPITSGIDLLRKIKECPSLEKILIYVLDGSSSPREIAECEKLGVTAFLRKPVSYTDLVEIVGPRIRELSTQP